VRIVHRPTGRTAEKRLYRSGAPAKYRAFPPSKNEIPDERSFDTIEELALFLLKNPAWKTWVAGNAGHSDGQVSASLVIEGSLDRDALKRKGLIP
jgi:hypothetical protein